MDAGHGGEDRIGIEPVAARGIGKLMRQHIEQHFGIGIGIDVAPVIEEQFALEFVGVGQIAVVPQHHPERGIHVERLRFGHRGS